MSARPTFAELFVPELRAEGELSRRFIARVPQDRLLWKPHEKSHTVGELAMHIALLPGNLSAAAMVEKFPVDNVGATVFVQPASVKQILDTHDAGIADAEKRLGQMSDADYGLLWNATMGGEVIMTLPRHAMLRNILFSHLCHHRGQLGAYLRLLGVAVPYSYGPSADEMPPFLAQRMEASAAR
jgi:uncharacterized damage-inducible protein DinB